MIIAVEQGLDSVKRALLSAGHRVVGFESGESYHVAVYLRTSIPDIFVPQAHASNALFGSGVFLVNAHGRTPEEICSIISQKAYGKLF